MRLPNAKRFFHCQYKMRTQNIPLVHCSQCRAVPEKTLQFCKGLHLSKDSLFLFVRCQAMQITSKSATAMWALPGPEQVATSSRSNAHCLVYAPTRVKSLPCVHAHTCQIPTSIASYPVKTITKQVPSKVSTQHNKMRYASKSQPHRHGSREKQQGRRAMRPATLLQTRVIQMSPM